MATASLMPLPKYQAIANINGVLTPINNGYVYCYIAGTTTLKDTYTTADGTTPNANPVRLNARGEASIFLGAGAYDIKLCDADNVEIWKQLNVRGSATVRNFETNAELLANSGFQNGEFVNLTGYYSAGDGGGMPIYWDSTSTATHNGGTVRKPTAVSGAGRWLAVNTTVINIKQFGARGDGVNNDYSAFVAVYDYCETNNRTVFVPDGVYKSDSYVYIRANTVGTGTLKGLFRIRKDNITVKDITLNVSGNDLGFIIDGSDASNRIKDITLDNVLITQVTPVANSLAINSRFCDNLAVRNCRFDYGIQLTDCRNYNISGNRLYGFANNTNELVHASLWSWGNIENNYFFDSYYDNIDLYSSGERSLILGNKFVNSRMALGTGIEIKIAMSDDTGNTSSYANGYTGDIIIANNVIQNLTPLIANAAFFNVYRIDNRAVPVFNSVEQPRNIIFSNNVFTVMTDTAITASTGTIQLFKIKEGIGISIVGTKQGRMPFTSANITFCFAELESCNHIDIMQNKATSGETGSSSAIKLTGNCNYVNISDNRFIDDSYAAVKNMTFINFGAGTHTHIFVKHNTTACSKAAISSTGVISNMKMVGNVIESAHATTGLLSFANLSSSDIVYNTLKGGGYHVCLLSLGTKNNLSRNRLESTNPTVTYGFQLQGVTWGNCNENTYYNLKRSVLVQANCKNINFSNNFYEAQTDAGFPFYSGISAPDQATMVEVNNKNIV